MEKSHYSLAWDKYHIDMCSGFSLLQQTGEMVDLTLAAEGQFIKVHQIVLRIASPFIRELLQSAECKHPVIFMNNMSYKTLCRILEYVYTGEVSIEEQYLGDFVETARTLQIRGLAEVVQHPKVDEPTVNASSTVLPIKKFQIEILDNKSAKLTEEVQTPDATRNVKMKRKLQCLTVREYEANNIDKVPRKRLSSEDGIDEATEVRNDSDHDYELLMSDDPEKEEGNKKKKDHTEPKGPKLCLQYTVSNKGSLQLILNRYMYNSRNYKVGPVRHWRCVDVCNGELRCPATAVTENDVVIRRVHMHNHPYHDKRILAKFQKKAVFSAIRTAESGIEVKQIDRTSGVKSRIKTLI